MRLQGWQLVQDTTPTPDHQRICTLKFCTIPMAENGYGAAFVLHMPFVKADWMAIQSIIFQIFNIVPEPSQIFGPKHLVKMFRVVDPQLPKHHVWQ
jgi:hypothetical protein